MGLLSELKDLLPAARIIAESSSRENAPPQETLRGDPELLKRAIAATPNITSAFPTRDQYVAYGVAIKAAFGPEREAEAFEAWWDWCERWQDPDGRVANYDLASGDWLRMKPPFNLGADVVYRRAYELSGGTFTRADVWFDPTPVDPAELPPEVLKQGANSRHGERSHYDFLTLRGIRERPDPVFMIDRHVPEESMGFLYGRPGCCKSFVALDMSLSIAFGRGDWHGDALRVKPRGVVVYLAGEGASGFKTRVAAWCAKHGVSEEEQDKGRFVLVYESVNFMKPADVEKLGRTIVDKLIAAGDAVAMVVVDTVSRSMPGADENLQKEMTLFVEACDTFRRVFGCCVLGVHHAGKSGDMRGSTVLKGAGDFVFRLDRAEGATVGTLKCEKQKDAPDGWSDSYGFEVVSTGGNFPKTSLVPMRISGGSVGAAGSGAVLTPDVAAGVRAAIAEAWAAGAPWGMTYRSRARYGVPHMVKRFGFKADAAEELLRLWVASGILEEVEYDKRNGSKGLRVISGDGQNVQGEAGLFD